VEAIRQRELVEEAIELLPSLGRLLKSTLCIPAEETSVPFGQIRVIALLNQSGRSTVGQVAAGIGVSLATASELVERGVNPADRRQVHLWLTPKAVAISDKLRNARRAQMASAFERLDPEDRPAFVRGLRALVDALEESVAATSSPVLD
jgi:DNA-binding MarR family transcriptional regulator